MKTWAYYDRLKRELEAAGLTVNVLPAKAVAPRTPVRRAESSVSGRRRQSSEASGAWKQHALRHFVQLHQSMGDLWLRDSAEGCVAAAGGVLLQTQI